jgi:AcrR family transcriptional regulator
MTTRERIRYEALNMFSEKGFDSVSVRDIASAVGIKESSLYNHYKNKQDIFDSIVSEYASRGNDFFYNIQILDNDKRFAVDERTVDMYKGMSPEQFEAISAQILEYYLCDEIVVKFRKMLTIEQYRSKELAKLYREFSFESSLQFQSQLFAVLMKEGLLIETDPYILAMEFFSPVFLIFYKFDNDEEGFAQAKELITQHVRHFNQMYGTKKHV